MIISEFRLNVIKGLLLLASIVVLSFLVIYFNNTIATGVIKTQDSFSCVLKPSVACGKYRGYVDILQPYVNGNNYSNPNLKVCAGYMVYYNGLWFGPVCKPVYGSGLGYEYDYYYVSPNEVVYSYYRNDNLVSITGYFTDILYYYWKGLKTWLKR